MEAYSLDQKPEDQIISSLICVACGGHSLNKSRDILVCEECHQRFPIVDGVVDCLFQPSVAVVNELKGMAMENNFSEDEYEKFKVRKLETPQGISEKLKITENDHSNYYLQTIKHFEQAVDSIAGHLVGKALEIGSCHDYYFLKKFHQKGAECFGVNLHFDLKKNSHEYDWVHKVLADMNRLPFKDNCFDLVIISATSHHSVTPEKLVKEIARVLKPRGKCLMINDPTWGIIKNLGGPDNTKAFRESHINENEYPIWRYNRMFRSADFYYEHLFSRFYDEKLQNFEIHPNTRFATIASLVKAFWRIHFMRSFFKKFCLWPAQAIFGFPMNVVLTKK